MKGLRKPRGGCPAERRAPLRRETTEAKIGAATLNGRVSSMSSNACTNNWPGATDQRFFAFIENHEIGGLSSNVWNSSASRVVKALPLTSKFAEILGHCFILIWGSGISVWKPSRRKYGSLLRLNESGSSNRGDKWARGWKYRKKTSGVLTIIRLTSQRYAIITARKDDGDATSA